MSQFSGFLKCANIALAIAWCIFYGAHIEQILLSQLRGACAALKVCNCRQLEPSMWPDPLRGARPVQTICVLIKSLLAGAPELASPDWGPKGSLSY